MRRILVAATILAAACGGKPTIQATPEIKATATTAAQGMSSTSTSTQASIGIQSIGVTVGDAVATGNVSTVDLSVGLSDPATVAAVAAAPQPVLARQALRASDPGATYATTAPTGCVKRQGGFPVLIASGTQGCTASDHLEVNYDNGDKVNITYTDSPTSFDLRVEVVAGPWTGTNLHFAGNVSNSGATVTLDGAMKFSKLGNPVHIDADFQLSYSVTGSGNQTSATASIRVTGTATDHIALVRAHEGWTLTVQSSTSPTTETVNVTWSGTVGVDVLKADGVTTDHSVAFNLNLTVSSTTTGGTSTATATAGGDIEYDGAVCGNIVFKNDDAYVAWTDGTEEVFDLSSMFGLMA